MQAVKRSGICFFHVPPPIHLMFYLHPVAQTPISHLSQTIPPASSLLQMLLLELFAFYELLGAYF